MQIYNGSILDCDVDAIVNPANSFLNHGGGLAKVIDLAANPRKGSLDTPEGIRATMAWLDDHKRAPLIPTGGALATNPGQLAFKGILGVIHVVAPVWGGGDYCEYDLLEIAHDNAYKVAQGLGYQSIAFPAIGCGIFGCPVDLVSEIAVTVAERYDMQTVYALMDDDHIGHYECQIAASKTCAPEPKW